VPMIRVDVVIAFVVGLIAASAIWWSRIQYAQRRRLQAEVAAEHTTFELNTARVKAERTQALYNAMLDAFPLPLLVTNRDRVITQANSAAAELFKTSARPAAASGCGKHPARLRSNPNAD